MLDVYDYVYTASAMLAFGACMECIVIITGYVIRSVFRLIVKGGG